MAGCAGHDGITSMLTSSYVTIGVPVVACSNRMAVAAEQAVSGTVVGIVRCHREQCSGAGTVTCCGSIRPRFIGTGQHPLD